MSKNVYITTTGTYNTSNVILHVFKTIHSIYMSITINLDRSKYWYSMKIEKSKIPCNKFLYM